MTTFLLIMLYVADESSYDKHHKDGARLYRIASQVKDEKWVATPAPLADGLTKDFPEVEHAVRLLRFPGTEKILLKLRENQKQFFETNAYYVDSGFFQLFTYDFKFGNAYTALTSPNSIVISEEVATKFFGNENPVGQVLGIGLSFGEYNYTIKGVFKTSGIKSHIPAKLFLSMDNGDVGGWVKSQTSWATNSIFHTYVKLREEADASTFERKIEDFLGRKGGEEFKAAGFEKKLFVQPVEGIYLHSNFGYEVAPNGNIRYLYIFGFIGSFLLIIACINFMNLSTARSEKRAKEVGMRKVIGGDRQSIIAQFLGESLLMSGLALGLTIIMTQLLIPAFNQLAHKELSFMQSSNIFIWLAVLTIVTGLISGLYPAFYLSSFKPISVLKGITRNTISAVAIRKGLVVFQFTVSIVLILGAILISQQMHYMRSENLGFDKNRKIILPLQTSQANVNANTLRNELLNDSQVIHVARGGAYPGIESVTSMLFYAEGKAPQENVELQTVYAEPGYLETLGIELLRGREFVQEFNNDKEALILNESAIKQLGYTVENAIGRKVYFDFQNSTQSMTIIGIVRDYHFQSLQHDIKPLALTVHPFFSGPMSYLIMDVNSRRYSVLIAAIQKTWNRINPDSPFAYSFLDQDFQRNYEKEALTSQIVRYFTAIAIVIACLGLFGLAAFTAEQRIKEVGIRKVFGASVAQVAALLSKDFLKLVLISIILSSPIAYYLMNKWLQSFAYHIDIQLWVFFLGGAAAVSIALVTVSFQAIKAAIANPVKSLRSE